MIKIGKIVLYENGLEAFNAIASESNENWEVEKSISGYYRLWRNEELFHDDSACEDVNDEDSAYYFFAELIKEYGTK